MWPFKKKPTFNKDVERLVNKIFALGLSEEDYTDGGSPRNLFIPKPLVKITDTVYLSDYSAIYLLKPPAEEGGKYDTECVMSEDRIYYEGDWQKTIIQDLEKRLQHFVHCKEGRTAIKNERLRSFGLKV